MCYHNMAKKAKKEIKKYNVKPKYIDEIHDADLQKERDRASKYRLKVIVKMMILFIVPIIACVTITVASMSKSYHDNQVSQISIVKLKENKMMVDLVADLQRERALRIFYLLYNFNATFFSRLTDIQQKVYEHLSNMTRTNKYFSDLIENELDLVNKLKQSRTDVNIRNILKVFRDINSNLIGEIVTSIRLPVDIPIWKYHTSLVMLLLAIETEGDKLLIGANYFLNCYITEEELTLFTSSSNAYHSYVEMAFTFDQSVKERHKKEADLVHERLEKMIKPILLNASACPTKKREKTDNSFVWTNLTFKHNEVNRKQVTSAMAYMIDEELAFEQETWKELTAYIVFLILMVIGSIVTLVWYAKCINKMTLNVNSYSLKMSREKKKAEKLLYQMLPQTVAG